MQLFAKTKSYILFIVRYKRHLSTFHAIFYCNLAVSTLPMFSFKIFDCCADIITSHSCARANTLRSLNEETLWMTSDDTLIACCHKPCLFVCLSLMPSGNHSLFAIVAAWQLHQPQTTARSRHIKGSAVTAKLELTSTGCCVNVVNIRYNELQGDFLGYRCCCSRCHGNNRGGWVSTQVSDITQEG